MGAWSDSVDADWHVYNCYSDSVNLSTSVYGIQYEFHKTAMGTDTWYHVASTYDGSVFRAYLNGVEDCGDSGVNNGTGCQATTGTVTDHDYNLNIGRRSSGEGYWDGLIYECAYFSEALTAQNLCDICECGLRGDVTTARDCGCTSACQTTTTTTTTTSSTTTTTLVAYTDAFTSIDSNWTQVTWDDGVLSVTSGAVYSGTTDSLMYRNTFTPNAGSNFACTLLYRPGTNESGAGVCTGVSDDGAPESAEDNAVCCYTTNSIIGLAYFENGNYVTDTKQWSTDTVDSGDYLAIVRTGTDTFACYWCDASATGCDAVSDWTHCYNSATGCDGTGSGDVTRSGITNPGSQGVYVWKSSVSEWGVNAMGGGQGTTLPAPATCAPNS